MREVFSSWPRSRTRYGILNSVPVKTFLAALTCCFLAAFGESHPPEDHGHTPADKAKPIAPPKPAKHPPASHPKKAAPHGSAHSEPAVPKGTEVCGTLKLAQEWTQSGSPYLVTGNIFVPITSQLRIAPGVEIRVVSKPRPCVADEWAHQKAKEDAHVIQELEKEKDEHAIPVTEHHDNAHEKAIAPKERNPTDPPPPSDFSDSNYTSLTIEGAFYCLGTPKMPVRFLPADTTQGAPPWDGIRLTGQREGRAEIGFTEIRGANTGLFVSRAELFIHHTLFAENNTGLRCGRHGNVTPVFCVFTRNRSAGLLIDKAVPHVVNNIFYGNRGYGIWSDGSKAMVIEYNNFFANGEDDCYRCPHDVLSSSAEGKPDSVDSHSNLRADPLFEGSQSFLERRQKDSRYDTPLDQVKDTAIAEAEKKSRWKWWKKGDDSKAFTPRGTGPFRLSEYSPLIQAGHPARLLRNPDGSRSDIGLFGGPQDRMTRNPFPGM
jgi:Right handed beta helix region